jgi:hypothetical protein
MLKLQSPVVFDVTTDGDIADSLGELRAKAKAIGDRMKELEGMLKEKRVKVAEGKRFRVAISYDVETSRTNWKTVAEYLKAPQDLIDACTTVSVSDRVTVKAHTKKA